MLPEHEQYAQDLSDRIGSEKYGKKGVSWMTTVIRNATAIPKP